MYRNLPFERDVRKIKLKSSFSLDSALFAFARSDKYLFFKAEDKDWFSQYAWDIENNELFFRAKNKKKEKMYSSKGDTDTI